MRSDSLNGPYDFDVYFIATLLAISTLMTLLGSTNHVEQTIPPDFKAPSVFYLDRAYYSHLFLVIHMMGTQLWWGLTGKFFPVCNIKLSSFFLFLCLSNGFQSCFNLCRTYCRRGEIETVKRNYKNLLKKLFGSGFAKYRCDECPKSGKKIGVDFEKMKAYIFYRSGKNGKLVGKNFALKEPGSWIEIEPKRRIMSLCSRTDLDSGEGHSNLGYNPSHGGSSKAKKWVITYN